MKDAMARPFDPRQRLSVTIHELGVARVGRLGADGVWTERDEPQRSMSVWIDDAERIDGGLMLSADDPLVALNECSCGEWVCNLVEGWAAKARRFGPYVLWILPDDSCYVFSADQYSETLGPGLASLPVLDEDDAWSLDGPNLAVRYLLADGSAIGIGLPGPLADAIQALHDWPACGLGELRPVEPPREAREIPAHEGSGLSLWVDVTPREDGGYAAFVPAWTRAPVWCAGPAADRLVAALTGRAT